MTNDQVGYVDMRWHIKHADSLLKRHRVVLITGSPCLCLLTWQFWCEVGTPRQTEQKESPIKCVLVCATSKYPNNWWRTIAEISVSNYISNWVFDWKTTTISFSPQINLLVAWRSAAMPLQRFFLISSNNV